MISYTSTRGDKKLYSFSETILKGIAADGGLFIPGRLPHFTTKDLEGLLDTSYQRRAAFLFSLFETDFEKGEIEKIIAGAYSNENFDNPLIAPTVHLKDNQYLLELWHGPTAAFKDMALQLMPLFFQEAIKKNKQNLYYLILVATSGDTGTAAAEGFKNRNQISIIVFYPDGLVSTVQELQMTTQKGDNVLVYSVKGDFDAVQGMVKDIFNDKEFGKELFSTYNTVLSAANSINWGRLIPQIVYHVQSYLTLVEKKIITLGDTIDVAVPSGNFGNLLAAYYVKKMGLPIRKLICASNENNALTKFLQTGVYDIQNRSLAMTPSPAMDILIASNIERLLYEISQDSDKVAAWMNDLKTKKLFEVDEETKKVLVEEFYADWVSNQDTLTNVKEQFEKTKYLIDPHTAVGQKVAERYINQYQVISPVVISSTAHWAKFPKDIYRAIADDDVSGFHDEFEIVEKILSLVAGAQVPFSIRSLKDKPHLHKENIKRDTEEVKRFIREWIKKQNS